MIKIMNLHNNKPLQQYDVIVDRRSVLGNLHILTNLMSDEMRNYVCEQYEADFERRLNKYPKIRKELSRITSLYEKHGQLRLFCWCAPKRCHAETIRTFILRGKRV